MSNDKTNTPVSPEECLTRETLWLQCVNFARHALDPDVDMKTLNAVAVKVFKAVKFLVKEPR